MKWGEYWLSLRCISGIKVELFDSRKFGLRRASASKSDKHDLSLSKLPGLNYSALLLQVEKEDGCTVTDHTNFDVMLTISVGNVSSSVLHGSLM